MFTDDTFQGISMHSDVFRFVDYSWLGKDNIATEMDFWFSGTIAPIVVHSLIYPLVLMVLEVVVFMY